MNRKTWFETLKEMAVNQFGYMRHVVEGWKLEDYIQYWDEGYTPEATLLYLTA